MRIFLIVLLVCSALGLSGAGFLLLKNRSAKPVVKVEPKEYVLVPQNDLFRGHVIGPGDLAWLEWPQSSAVNFISSKTKDDSFILKYNGRVLRSEVSANTPIIEKSFISKDVAGGLISSLLETGKRAYTLSVSIDTGGAGFILPGDYVDIILVQNLRDKLPRGKSGQSEIKLTDEILNSASETIVQNVKVLAVGKKTFVARSSASKDVTPVESVTVEVDQSESEKLALAKTLGSISVVLRSLADDKSDSASRYVADTEASKALDTVIKKLEQSSELSPTLDSSGSSSGKPEVTAAKTKSIMIYTGRSVFQKTVQSE
jgi:pilus assembly protein CpaB